MRAPEAAAPHVARIVRYPVKGLPGVDAPTASIAPGRGLLGDRVLAIERGALPVERPTGWNPRETYFHVAKTEQIALFDTALEAAESDAAVVTITAPNGREVAVRLDPAGFSADRGDADAFFARELPAGPLGPPSLARTGVQLWDWPAAQISIINLATVRAIEEAAGAPVDPRRFRANVYLDGVEPWGELALLGTTIRIGDAEFEVFQPTDRCRATTIDPVSAVSDLNVPALLAGRFGHMFCGVYARPVRGGVISTGDALLAAPRVDALAGAQHDWPRAATVIATSSECADVTSIWLSDSAGLAQTSHAGQHIRVHVPGEQTPAWRCYTISGVSDDGFRISVKRDGRVSSALHDRFAPGSGLIVSGPFGDVTLELARDRDILFLSAGIGITPTVAMLRGLEELAPTERRVRVMHVDRHAVPLWDEAVASAAALGADARLHLTRGDAGQMPDAVAGRPDAAAYRTALEGLDPANLAVFACGPAGFTAEARLHLAALGVADDDIHVEVFFSPSTAALAEPREPSTAGPHTIVIGDDVIAWRAESGSILDAVEGIGVLLPSGCRVGACGTCVQRLRSGTVEYLQDPVTPPKAGHVLVCCSVPVGDIEIGELA